MSRKLAIEFTSGWRPCVGLRKLLNLPYHRALASRVFVQLRSRLHRASTHGNEPGKMKARSKILTLHPLQVRLADRAAAICCTLLSAAPAGVEAALAGNFRRKTANTARAPSRRPVKRGM